MRRSLLVLSALSLALLAPSAFAIDFDACPIPGLSCAGGAADQYLFGIITNGVKMAFLGVLFAMMIWYAVRLIAGADKDNTISETRLSYAYAAVGTILAGGAFVFADTFAIPGALVNQGPTIDLIESGVVVTLKAMLFACLIFNLFYQGLRLVLSQDDSQAEKAKKQFLYGMIGAAIVLLADAIVSAFLGVNIGIVNENAVGIANFLGAVFGALAVIAVLVSGLYLVISIDDGNKEKAKKVLIGALTALVIVVASLAIMKVFIFVG